MKSIFSILIIGVSFLFQVSFADSWNTYNPNYSAPVSNLDLYRRAIAYKVANTINRQIITPTPVFYRSSQPVYNYRNGGSAPLSNYEIYKMTHQ